MTELCFGKNILSSNALQEISEIDHSDRFFLNAKADTSRLDKGETEQASFHPTHTSEGHVACGDEGGRQSWKRKYRCDSVLAAAK